MIDAILFGYSSFGALPGTDLLSKALCIGALTLILAKLLTDRYYSLRYMLLMIVIGSIFLAAFFNSAYNHLLYFMMCFLGAREVRTKQILKIDFACKFLLTAFIILCSLSGLIENYITYRTGEELLRYSLGFTHPNTLASIVLSLIAEEAYISERKPDAVYSALIWLGDIVLYLITANRTAVLLIAFFPFLLACHHGPVSVHSRRIPNKIHNILSMSVYPAAAVFSLLVMKFVREIPLFTLIDRLSSSRFYNAKVLFMRYGTALLGQRVELISVRTARLTQSSIALLDVAYLRLFIQAGPLVLLIICGLYCRACGIASAQGNRLLLKITIVFIIYGLFESGANNVYINFTVLLVSQMFYQKEIFRKDNKHVV